MDIISKRIGKFVAPGREVKTENGSIRPEVDVSIASMKISNLTIKKGMSNVEGTADGAEFSHSGYVSISEPIFKLIEKAKEDETVLLFRFEKKRKSHIDPTIPIAELAPDMNTARKNIVKTLCGVYDFKNEEWILTDEAQSNPAEDPAEIWSAIKGLSISVEDFFASPSTPAGGSAPAISSAEREHENKANALVSMYFFLLEQEKANNFKLSHGDRLEASKLFLRLADSIQMQTFDLDEPAYSAYTHTRARFMLFQLVENLVPFDEAASKDMKGFANKITAGGIQLWKWALAEADEI